MRCLSCDKALNKYESVSKYVTTGEYLDLCTRCRKAAELPEGTIQDNHSLYSDKEEE